MRYQIGDRVTITTTFTDAAGVPTSPDELVGEYRRPNAAAPNSLAPQDLGNGVVETSPPVFDVPGVWRWWIAGTAGVIAADQGTLVVDPKITDL